MVAEGDGDCKSAMVMVTMTSGSAVYFVFSTFLLFQILFKKKLQRWRC